MASREKRLEAIRAHPKQVRFAALRSALVAYGFSVRPGKGDHWSFTHPLLPLPVGVDPRRPFILRVYVKNALQAIDEVRAKMGENG